jgi:hypothetical protein
MDPDELYGLPLDRFIAERGQLAKSLRAEGRRDEAAAVASLRKPSVAAWAVNQLFRTQGTAVGELIDAGDGLRAAQSALLDGRGAGEDLRGAMQRERAAVDALMRSARGLLSSDGHELSPTVLERVGDTLHAAALSDEARTEIDGGRLVRELRHVGLGVDGIAAPARPPADPKRAQPTPTDPERVQPEPKPDRAEKDRARREQAERRQAEREHAEARKAARGAESDARRRAERASRKLRTAEERHEKAARALAEAASALAQARAEDEAAAAEHARTRADLEPDRRSS